jgi:hypothetical protein
LRALAHGSAGPPVALLQFPPMKRRKISAALAKVARAIHDSEAFLIHVGSIADRYRREHALDTGPRGREVRQALRTFRRHAAGLVEWLSTAQSRPSSLEHEALTKIAASLRTAPNQLLATSGTFVEWLKRTDSAAGEAETQLTGRKRANAPLIAAEALRATYEHHGLKWSTQVTKRSVGSAVQLLCAIAKSAGDELTPEEARAALLAATRGAGGK